MSRLTRRDFEPVDTDDCTNDPNLAVDGLGDLLPERNTLELDDHALAVSSLGDFFAEETGVAFQEHSGDDAEYYGSGIDTAPLMASQHEEAAAAMHVDVDDQFGYELPSEDLADTFEEVEPIVETTPAPAFQSDIQRAALEFQLFAERFHAFASQCQATRSQQLRHPLGAGRPS